MTWLVYLYRYTVGLLLAPSCRYLPTCSDYALQAVKEHGSIKGSYLATKRLCRCHPLSAGGVDEVPQKLFR